MKNRFFYFVILLLAVCLSANANDFKKKRKKQETTPALADALKKEKTEDKSYDKVITKEARTKKGLITLHMVKSTFYMEIPVKLMGKPMLFAGRVARSATIRMWWPDRCLRIRCWWNGAAMRKKSISIM